MSKKQSKKAKGNYYRLRAKKYFEEQGYYVEICEMKKAVWIRGHIIYVSKDMLASDLILTSKDEFILVNVKSNRNDVAKGLREFANYPIPEFIKKWVVLCEPRKQPEIFVFEKGKNNDNQI